MRKETVKQVILTADSGKYLTNGDTFGKTVILPEKADQSEWREITEEEYQHIIDEQNKEDDYV